MFHDAIHLRLTLPTDDTVSSDATFAMIALHLTSTALCHELVNRRLLRGCFIAKGLLLLTNLSNLFALQFEIEGAKFVVNSNPLLL